MERSSLASAFAYNLLRLRRAAGKTQEELGEDSQMHRNVIGRLERGELNPTLETVERLAAALNVHPGELLRDAPSKPWRPPPKGSLGRKRRRAD